MKKWIPLTIWLALAIALGLILTTAGCSPKVDPAAQTEVDHITVEVYWHSTCSYCIKELDVIEQISHEVIGHPYLDGKVMIIAKNLDLSPKALQAFLQEFELGTSPYLSFTTGETLPRWSTGYPTIIVKDTFGATKFQWIGLANKAELYSMIMETLDLWVKA